MKRRLRQRQFLTLRPFAEHDAEADAIIHRLRHPRRAIRRTQQPRLHGMTATADHAEVAIDTTERIGLLCCLIRPIPVRTPLGDIAMHVEEPPSIRRRLGDPHGELRGLRLVFGRQFLVREKAITQASVTRPRMESRREGIPRMKKRRRARTARKLPLRLRRQTIRLALLLRQPVTKRHRLIPTHLCDRVVLGLPAMLRIKEPILPHRDLRGAHPKALRHRHAMSWLFIPVCVIKLLRMLLHLIIRCRSVLPHGKVAGRYRNHLHADGIRDGVCTGRCGEEKENKQNWFHCVKFTRQPAGGLLRADWVR